MFPASEKKINQQAGLGPDGKEVGQFAFVVKPDANLITREPVK